MFEFKEKIFRKFEMKTKLCLQYMEEEFKNGQRSIINFLKGQGFLCSPEDDCGRCNDLNKLLRKRFASQGLGEKNG